MPPILVRRHGLTERLRIGHRIGLAISERFGGHALVVQAALKQR